VFLADDQSVLRQGLKTVLRQEGFEVVGEASDGHTAIKMCLTLQPQIVILDVGMPLLNGIDAAREIHKSCPRTKIILLTSCTDELSILTSIRAGINGYVLKNGAFSTLVEAIKAVYRGETYLSSGISGTIVQAYLSNSEPSSDPLSLRERQVLQLIAEGKSMKEIGGVLGISARTAETHRGRIMQKLNIFNIAGLVRYALKHGLVIEGDDGVDGNHGGSGEPPKSK
jgi:two-component system, NarL family, response regulator NreC